MFFALASLFGKSRNHRREEGNTERKTELVYFAFRDESGRMHTSNAIIVYEDVSPTGMGILTTMPLQRGQTFSIGSHISPDSTQDVLALWVWEVSGSAFRVGLQVI
jgi:hypothetical protein